MIAGSLCKLRPVKQEDLEELFTILNDLEVKETLRDVLPESIEKLARFLKSGAFPASIVFAVEYHGRISGIASLDKINWISRNAYLGIALGKEYWGKGIGEEATRLLLMYAFEYLNLHKVNLEVYEYNERAMKLYKDLGFKEEGRLRKNNFRHGKYHDVIIMGMLSKEYFEIHGRKL